MGAQVVATAQAAFVHGLHVAAAAGAVALMAGAVALLVGSRRSTAAQDTAAKDDDVPVAASSRS